MNKEYTLEGGMLVEVTDSPGFIIKDSGVRAEFDSGMVRDTAEGKPEYSRVFDGPMFDRWAEHLTTGAVKYPDVSPGVANWTLARSQEELLRFRESALHHVRQWVNGERDEDHAAALFFNVNGYEYVRDRLKDAAARLPRELPATTTQQPFDVPIAFIPTWQEVEPDTLDLSSDLFESRG
jgi:hypothetical protein